MTAVELPTHQEFLKWRLVSEALRAAAEVQQRPTSERPEIYEQLAVMPLFSHVRAGDETRRRGRYISQQLVAAVRRLRPRNQPISPNSLDRQAQLCWYLRVVEGRPSDRAVAEAVGRTSSPYLLEPWGTNQESRQATVRARMWTGASAFKRANREAWPGIAQLMSSVEDRLGPFDMPVEERSLDDGALGAEPAPIETIGAVREIRAGVRRNNRQHLRQDDLRILSWHHKIRIDHFGNSSSELRIQIMGKQHDPVDHIDFPVFYDGSARPIADCRSGRQRSWRQVPAEWDPDTGGFYKLPIEPPLANAKQTTMQVKYRLADVYQDGREWFEWYFAREQKAYDLSITASPEWTLEDVEVSCPEHTTRELPNPNNRPDGFDWHIDYPEIGHRYRLEWKMEPSSGASHRHVTPPGSPGARTI